MTPQLALFGCYGFIAWLLRTDFKLRTVGTRALLIPGAWIAIQGSRPVSYWFGDSGGSESDPVNTFVYAVFIGSALLVLSRKSLNWAGIIQRNKALFLIYFYLMLSMLWSEMPLTSLKRLIKDFGVVLMVFIILSEADPATAARVVFVRISYILFPLSVIYIKFFPSIGRSFSNTGEPMFGGVTTQKNSLGETVFVCGLFLMWDLMEMWVVKKRKGNKFQISIRVGMLLMGLWLLVKCDSQTSLVCLILGSAVFFGGQFLLRLKHGKKILIAGLASAICLVAVDKSFGISDMIIRALGRDPSLTGRTDIWRIVLDQKTDPILGNGFYTFWDSSKGKAVINAFMVINSTHNGYLESYVDGGLIAVGLLILLIWVAGGRVIDALFAKTSFGKIGLVFWILAIIYNFSESSFFRLDLLWLTFLLVMVRFPQGRSRVLLNSRPMATPERSYGIGDSMEFDKA